MSILEHLQNDLIFYLIMFVFLLFGGAAIWMMAKMKSMSEVNLLKREIDRLELQQVEKLEQYEDQCIQLQEDLRLLLCDLRSAITKNETKQVKAIRNTISNTICTDFVQAYYEYTRLATRLYGNDASKFQSFLEQKLKPFLELSGNIISVINQRNVLAMAEAKSLLVNSNSFVFAIDLIEERIGIFDFSQRKKFKHQVRQLNLKAA